MAHQLDGNVHAAITLRLAMGYRRRDGDNIGDVASLTHDLITVQQFEEMLAADWKDAEEKTADLKTKMNTIRSGIQSSVVNNEPPRSDDE